MSVFLEIVTDKTIDADGNGYFRLKSSAQAWAERATSELGSPVTPQKVGNGWALAGEVDDVRCIWGVRCKTLCRIN